MATPAQKDLVEIVAQFDPIENHYNSRFHKKSEIIWSNYCKDVW